MDCPLELPMKTMFRMMALLCLLMAILPAPASAQGVMLADRWYAEPYLYPQVKAQNYTTSSGGLSIYSLGAGVGGLLHDLDTGILSGLARVEGGLWSGGGGLGFDVRAGPHWQPRLKWIGWRIGLDPFYNQFTSSILTLPGSVGLAIPMDITLGPRNAYLTGGVSPAFLANSARRVDWSTADVAVGLGHEFEWRLGGGLTLGRYSMSLVLSRHTTIMGSAYGVALGFHSAPFVPPAVSK